MSLINQALRKAQQDRSPKRMSRSSEPSDAQTHQMASSTPGMKPGILIGLVAAMALLIGLVVGLTIVIFKDSSPAASVAEQPQLQPLEAMTPPAAPMSEPELTPTAPTQTAASAPSATAPSLYTTAPIPAPVVSSAPNENSVLEQLRLAREAAQAKAAEEAAIAAEAKRIAAIEPNQEIINWLSEAKVTGVRLAGDDSKAIINNKAYATDELVHYSLGIQLIAIQESRLLFQDANGKRYMKRL